MARIQNDEVRNLLLEITRCLVDDAQAIRVECIEKGELRTLNLSVPAIEACKIFGKNGHTARSLRTILSAAGTKLNRRYQLNIQARAGGPDSEHAKDGLLVPKGG